MERKLTMAFYSVECWIWYKAEVWRKLAGKRNDQSLGNSKQLSPKDRPEDECDRIIDMVKRKSIDIHYQHVNKFVKISPDNIVYVCATVGKQHALKQIQWQNLHVLHFILCEPSESIEYDIHEKMLGVYCILSHFKHIISQWTLKIVGATLKSPSS